LALANGSGLVDWLYVRAQMKKTISIVSIFLLVIFIGYAVIKIIGSAGNINNPDAQLEAMLPEEREFCKKVLWQIKPESSVKDVITLLGKPSRDLKLKKNWWMKLNGKKDRVGVYFTLSGFAEEVVLDGGPGRFYYRRKVSDHVSKNF